MSPYQIPDWSNFFFAAAGASAALAGLVIVAVSVNIQQILKYSHLPVRAGATVATLVLILTSSMAGLIPQPLADLGIESLVLGIMVWLLHLASARKALVVGAEYHRPLHECVFEIVAGQIQTLPFMVGGILLLRGHRAGLYWMAGGSIAIFIFSVMNVWVLLVEILR